MGVFNLSPPSALTPTIYRAVADAVATASTITVPPWLLWVQNANQIMVMLTTLIGLIYVTVRLWRFLRYPPDPQRSNSEDLA